MFMVTSMGPSSSPKFPILTSEGDIVKNVPEDGFKLSTFWSSTWLPQSLGWEGSSSWMHGCAQCTQKNGTVITPYLLLPAFLPHISLASFPLCCGFADLSASHVGAMSKQNTKTLCCSTLASSHFRPRMHQTTQVIREDSTFLLVTFSSLIIAEKVTRGTTRSDALTLVSLNMDKEA